MPYLVGGVEALVDCESYWERMLFRSVLIYRRHLETIVGAQESSSLLCLLSSKSIVLGVM